MMVFFINVPRLTHKSSRTVVLKVDLILSWWFQLLRSGLWLLLFLLTLDCLTTRYANSDFLRRTRVRNSIIRYIFSWCTYGLRYLLYPHVSWMISTSLVRLSLKVVLWLFEMHEFFWQFLTIQRLFGNTLILFKISLILDKLLIVRLDAYSHLSRFVTKYSLIFILLFLDHLQQFIDPFILLLLILD